MWRIAALLAGATASLLYMYMGGYMPQQSVIIILLPAFGFASIICIGLIRRSKVDTHDLARLRKSAITEARRALHRVGGGW